jgi:sulfur-oxidizing protein SoxX
MELAYLNEAARAHGARAWGAWLWMASLLALPVHADGGATAGQKLAFDVAKGNCLACHAIPGDPAAVTSADIGPPLVGIQARFPKRERLREQLDDPMKFNPNTVMPPFGRHGILSAEEIDRIVDYLYTL